MTRQAAESLFRRKSEKYDPTPRNRAYVFAVVALAFTLVGMLIFPKSARFYLGETIVGHSCGGTTAKAAVPLQIDPTEEILGQCRALRPSADAASQLKTELRSDENGEEGSRQIVIRWRGRDSQRTTDLLQQVADAYITAHQRPADTTHLDSRREDLETNIEFWDAQLETTSRELESFVQRELSRRRAAASPPAPDSTAEDTEELTSPATIPSMPAVQTPNAKWKNLYAQLAEADVRLQRLLLTHTDEHPLVIEARRIVEGLRTELAATPKVLAVVPEVNPFVASRTPAFTSAEGGPDDLDDQPAFDEPLARRQIMETSTARALASLLAETRAKRQAVLQQLLQLPPAASLVSERSWLVQPPQITDEGPTRVQAGSLWGMFLPAAIAGLFFAALPNVVTRPDYLCSVDDAARSLRLAVRGTLCTGDGPTFAPMPSDRIPALVRRCVAASEIAIGLTIVAVLLCALFIPGYGENMIRDPIDALGTTFQRLGIHR